MERQATAQGADLLGAVANVKIDGIEHDLLILDRGFAFVSDPGKADKGEQRLRELVASASPDRLASYHRFLPFEEIATTRIEKRIPARAQLVLHGGRTVELKETGGSELLEKHSRDTLLRVLDSLRNDD